MVLFGSLFVETLALFVVLGARFRAERRHSGLSGQSAKKCGSLGRARSQVCALGYARSLCFSSCAGTTSSGPKSLIRLSTNNLIFRRAARAVPGEHGRVSLDPGMIGEPLRQVRHVFVFADLRALAQARDAVVLQSFLLGASALKRQLFCASACL